MSNIYQRIGEAIASQGKINLLIALSIDDELVLRASNFKHLGSTEINGILMPVFSTEIEVPKNTKSTNRVVDSWEKLLGGDNTKGKFVAGTSPLTATYTPEGTVTKVSVRGDQFDAEYNPLSILDDYFFSARSVQVDPQTTVDLYEQMQNNLDGKK